MAIVPQFGGDQSAMDKLITIPPPQDPPTLMDLQWASLLVDVTRDAHSKLSKVHHVVQYAHSAMQIDMMCPMKPMQRLKSISSRYIIRIW